MTGISISPTDRDAVLNVRTRNPAEVVRFLSALSRKAPACQLHQAATSLWGHRLTALFRWQCPLGSTPGRPPVPPSRACSRQVNPLLRHHLNPGHNPR